MTPLKQLPLLLVVLLFASSVQAQYIRGLMEDTASGGYKFVSMDVQTEQIVELSAIPSLDYAWSQPGIVNRNTNTYYIFGNDTAGLRMLYAIDLIDGSLIDVINIPNIYALHHNPTDGLMYGLRALGTGQFVKVNPANGNVTVMTGINIAAQVGGYFPESGTIHGASKKYYLGGDNHSNDDRLFEYSIDANGSFENMYAMEAKVLRAHNGNNKVYGSRVVGGFNGRTQVFSFEPDSLPSVQVIVDSLPIESNAGNPGYKTFLDPDANIYYHHGIKTLQPNTRSLLMIDINSGIVQKELDIETIRAPAGTIYPPNIKFNRIKGQVYFDANTNGMKDANEGPLTNRPLLLLPDSFLAYTNSKGKYNLPVGPGTYQLSIDTSGPFVLTSTPSSYDFTFTSNGGDTSENDFGMNTSGPEACDGDMALDVQNAAAFQISTELYHYITFTNLGNTTMEGTISYERDTLFNWEYADPAPASISGNTYYFNYNDMYPGELRQIQIVLSNPVDMSTIGKEATSVATFEYCGEDTSNTLIIIDTTRQIITSAWDPNDKTVMNNNRSQLAGGSWLDYRVRFQNTGNAPALNVVIRDTLDELVEPSTFQMRSSSHDYNVYLKGNVVTWEFPNIMLPDSGADMAGSNGFVRFYIRIDSSATSGDVIRNSAAIYFDINPAVITNQTEVTIPHPQGITEHPSYDPLKVYPNPSSSTLYVKNAANEEIVIRDLTGRIVKMSYAFSDNEPVDISDLFPGIYLISAGNKVAKFVKQ